MFLTEVTRIDVAGQGLAGASGRPSWQDSRRRFRPHQTTDPPGHSKETAHAGRPPGRTEWCTDAAGEIRAPARLLVWSRAGVRIGHYARSGYYPVPHRYRLHLTLSCPHCLQIAVTHSLLGLDDTLPVTLLPALPDAGDNGYLALRPLYEASSHQHPGAAEAPVLSDGWSGRIVSTDPAEILTNLARRFPGPDLYPCGLERAIAAVRQLCERSINAPAQRAGQADATPAARATALRSLLDGLAAIERRLGTQKYLLGEELPSRTCSSG